MTEKTKNVLLGVLIVGLVSMTVAYAALTQTLNINGSATVQNITSSWHVRFRALDSAKDGNTYTDVTETQYGSVNSGTLSFSNDSTLVTLPQVSLKAPGDKVEFVWVVENTGDINAKLTGVTPISLGTLKCGSPLSAECTGTGKPFADSTAQSTFVGDISVTFTYADGTAFAANSDTLAKTSGKSFVKATVEYVKRETEQTLPATDVTFDGITAALTYSQDSNS